MSRLNKCFLDSRGSVLLGMLFILIIFSSLSMYYSKSRIHSFDQRDYLRLEEAKQELLNYALGGIRSTASISSGVSIKGVLIEPRVGGRPDNDIFTIERLSDVPLGLRTPDNDESDPRGKDIWYIISNRYSNLRSKYKSSVIGAEKFLKVKTPNGDTIEDVIALLILPNKILNYQLRSAFKSSEIYVVVSNYLESLSKGSREVSFKRVSDSGALINNDLVVWITAKEMQTELVKVIADEITLALNIFNFSSDNSCLTSIPSDTSKLADFEPILGRLSNAELNLKRLRSSKLDPETIRDRRLRLDSEIYSLRNQLKDMGAYPPRSPKAELPLNETAAALRMGEWSRCFIPNRHWLGKSLGKFIQSGWADDLQYNNVSSRKSKFSFKGCPDMKFEWNIDEKISRLKFSQGRSERDSLPNPSDYPVKLTIQGQRC